VRFGRPEQFSFTGAKGDTVYGYVVYPADFDPAKKYPVAFLIHGGPQGMFGNDFHYRWNPQAYAGAGYAVVMVDFHGSTGYGQAFTDAINDDWGGAPFEDLMKGLDFALAKYPFLDKDRMGALGASYGGYMINWVAGHTDRFKCLVCHDGNLDERFAYFDTEELWFPEWEHRGTPWENPQGYAKVNPIDFVKNWKTPTLVVHGMKDFRIPYSEGLATFDPVARDGAWLAGSVAEEAVRGKRENGRRAEAGRENEMRGKGGPLPHSFPCLPVKTSASAFRAISRGTPGGRRPR
jgi:dipeptidyl aminopeptidase/acylaminoacyl peptidase